MWKVAHTSWASCTGPLVVDSTQPLIPLMPVQVTFPRCSPYSGERQMYKNMCKDVKCTQEAHNLEWEVLSQDQSSTSPGDISQYLEVFVVDVTGGSYWHVVGRDQGRCYTCYNAQDGPPTKNYPAQMSVVPRLGNPVLKGKMRHGKKYNTELSVA